MGSTIRTYHSIADYERDAGDLMQFGWRPVSLSTTLRDGEPQMPAYHVLYVRDGPPD